MRRCLIIAGLLVAGTAFAAYRDIERTDYGQWTFTAAIDDSDNTYSCAVSTHWNNSGREVRLVALQQPYSLNLAVRDPSWSAGRGRIGTMRLNVDGRSWTANADGINATLINARLATDGASVGRFIAAFKAGNTLSITTPWGERVVAGLRGSSAATTAMQACMDRYFGGRPPAMRAQPGYGGGSSGKPPPAGGSKF